MSINLRLSASPSGTQNVFDNTLNFSSFGGSPSASAAMNTTAAASFRTAYSALSGRTRLIFDPGTYNFSSGLVLASTGNAGQRLTVEGYGAIITAPGGQSNNLLPSALGNNNTNNAKFATASAGSSTISLVTSGQTSLFTSGRWVLLTGIDMQGYGYPPNPGVFEFKKILNIGSGTLTFTEPLINTYKDTWPNYAAGSGFEIDQGGPGNVYVIGPQWDQEIEIKGLRFTDTGNLSYACARSVRWIDCTFDTYGPCPSMSLLYQSIRCVGAGFGGLEVDKCAHRVEFIDTMHRAIDFQSASVNELYVNNMTQSPTPRFQGGAKNSNTFINLNTGAFNFGEQNYGPMGPVVMTNCSATSSSWNIQTCNFSDMTEEGGGVLSFSGGPCPPSNAFLHWMVPGQNAVLLDASNNWARSFQVSDLTSSGGRTYVTTNLPFPVPSTINGRSAPWKIASHPCPSVTMTNCTGNSLFTTHSGLPAGTPFNQWTL